MLEKILYMVASYFCIGTEYRFLAVKEPGKYEKKDGELWHAKAMHLAATFLPSSCPLVNHVIQAYIKHHLKPKLEERQTNS